MNTTKTIPCNPDADKESDATKSNPEYFFLLLGVGVDLELEEEPEEPEWGNEKIAL